MTLAIASALSWRACLKSCTGTFATVGSREKGQLTCFAALLAAAFLLATGMRLFRRTRSSPVAPPFIETAGSSRWPEEDRFAAA